MVLRENEWFIEAPWGRICVIAWGNCLDPPVLLCHGGMDTAVSFRPLVQRLPKNFYYIGMELPGSGKSDRLPPGLMISTYDLVYAIDAVASHFRWNTFVFIGHSMGAYLGKFFNISCPGRLSKLIELDAINIMGWEADRFALWYQMCFTNYYDNVEKYNMPKERAPKLTWNKALESVIKARGLSPADAAATLARLSEPAGEGLVRYTFDPRMRILNPPAFSTDYIRKVMTASPTPTLSIVCEDSLQKELFRNTLFLLDESIYPHHNYRCRKVEGTHDVHIINPDLVASYVRPFLLNGLEALDAKAKL